MTLSRATVYVLVLDNTNYYFTVQNTFHNNT